MRRRIKKFGSSLIIRIDWRDRDVYGIDKGDVIEMKINKVIKNDDKR